MGFGLLLFGYFTITVASVGMGDFRFIAYLLGGMLCAMATARLKAYNPRFLLTLCLAVVYGILGLYDGFAMLDNTFLWGILPIGGVLNSVVDAVTLLVNIAFHFTMLWSIMELAHSLGMTKLKARTTRNLFFVVVYGIGEAVMITYPRIAELENQMFPRILLLYLLVCYLLNAWLLFSCYQSICPAGEEFGKPAKPSRFAFVNKLNQKFDEKATRALREQMEYQAEKQAKRQNKKKKKK